MQKTTTIKTFKNTKFTGRDYECINIVACQGETAPAAWWLECDKSVLNGLMPLWIEAGRRYFGWM